jgi:hypothetical protein
VFSFFPLMEKLKISAIQHINSILGVGTGVGMHDVHNDNQPHLMGGVDQLFEVVRLAEPAAGGEEICDVVAETPVVGVFLDRHQLNAVVT